MTVPMTTARRVNTAQLAKLYPAVLQKPRKFFTWEEITDLFNVPAFPPFAVHLTLSPGVPRSGGSFLTFFSALLLDADLTVGNNFALFSSKYAPLVIPTVQVSFAPGDKTKQYLVEFNLSINNPALVYRFRLTGPLGQTQDVTLNTNQIVPYLVTPIPPDIGNYAVSIEQLNPASDDAGWAFHSVQVTTIG